MLDDTDEYMNEGGAKTLGELIERGLLYPKDDGRIYVGLEGDTPVQQSPGLTPDEVQGLILLVESHGINGDDLWRAKHDLKYKYGDDETRWNPQDLSPATAATRLTRCPKPPCRWKCMN